MRKETFLNLEQAKQKRVIDASIDEFSKNYYELASVNQIVAKAEISKGSFYQYFENKESLYKYIVKICMDDMIKHIELKCEGIEDDTTFKKLELVLAAMTSYSKECEKKANILEFFYKDFELDNIMEFSIEDLALYQVLEKGILKGDLRNDFDIELMTNTIIGIWYTVKGYTERENKRNAIEDNIKEVVSLLELGLKSEVQILPDKDIEYRFY